MNQASAIMAILAGEAAKVAHELARACERAHDKFTVLQEFTWDDDDENDAASESEDVEPPTADKLDMNTQGQADLPLADAQEPHRMVAQSDDDVFVPDMSSIERVKTRIRLNDQQTREMNDKIIEILKFNPRGLDRNQIWDIFRKEKIRSSLAVVTRRMYALTNESIVKSIKDGRNTIYQLVAK